MNFIKTKLKSFWLFIIALQISYGANSNQLLSQLDSTATSLGQEVAKVIGNIGLGVALITLLGYIIGLMMNAERVKEHFKTILIVILAGGIVKVISAMSIGTVF